MIWIVGNNGMLGRELEGRLTAEGLLCVGSDLDVSILEPGTLSAFAETHHPDWIVNCSAYTSVDKAEEDSDFAYALNRDGVANLANCALATGSGIIHISTDYVFDGKSSEPLDENAGTGPVGVYGKSKLAGEATLRELFPRHIIIRTAWLYGGYGKNFVSTMISLMNSNDTLKIVDDQIGSPTWTYDLSSAIVGFLSMEEPTAGTYHYSGKGRCSWFSFAREIYRLGLQEGLITSACALAPCSSDEYFTPASRPAYSLLSKEKIERVLDLRIPEWQDSLRSFIGNLKKY